MSQSRWQALLIRFYTSFVVVVEVFTKFLLPPKMPREFSVFDFEMRKTSWRRYQFGTLSLRFSSFFDFSPLRSARFIAVIWFIGLFLSFFRWSIFRDVKRKSLIDRDKIKCKEWKSNIPRCVDVTLKPNRGVWWISASRVCKLLKNSKINCITLPFCRLIEHNNWRRWLADDVEKQSRLFIACGAFFSPF